MSIAFLTVSENISCQFNLLQLAILMIILRDCPQMMSNYSWSLIVTAFWYEENSFIDAKSANLNRDVIDQWISTFMSLRHTNFENKFDSTHKRKKRPKWWKYRCFCILSLAFYDLAAHLESLTAHLCVAARRLRNAVEP
jgi:hypothetical protein